MALAMMVQLATSGAALANPYVPDKSPGMEIQDIRLVSHLPVIFAGGCREFFQHFRGNIAIHNFGAATLHVPELVRSNSSPGLASLSPRPRRLGIRPGAFSCLDWIVVGMETLVLVSISDTTDPELLLQMEAGLPGGNEMDPPTGSATNFCSG